MPHGEITLTYPRHKVEYDDPANMLDVELDGLLQEINMDEMTDEERKNAVKVLKFYKEKLESED